MTPVDDLAGVDGPPESLSTCETLRRRPRTSQAMAADDFPRTLRRRCDGLSSGGASPLPQSLRQSGWHCRCNVCV